MARASSGTTTRGWSHAHLVAVPLEQIKHLNLRYLQARVQVFLGRVAIPSGEAIALDRFASIHGYNKPR